MDRNLTLNLTSNPRRGQTYKWDAFNRLARVDGAGRILARYLYDATGRRLRKDIPAAAEASFATGYHNATRVATNYDAGVAWTNPENLMASGCATAAFSSSGSSMGLYASGYNFAVPLGATIDRIDARIARFCANGYVYDAGVDLVWPGGSVGGRPYDDATQFATGWEEAGYAAEDYTWGRAWSPAELNSPAFGVALHAASDDEDTASIDYITVAVWYTLPAAARQWTDYAWDGWQILEQRVNGGTYPDRQWVYGVYIDEPLVMDVNGNGDASCTGSGDSRYFYHQNLNYSVLGLTNASGVLIEAYEYTPYGRHVVLSDGDSDGAVEFDGTDVVSAQDAPSELGNIYLYTGRQFDEETGIYYYRHRYYDAQVGRFISRDPAGYIDGPNIYCYVYNNPLNNTDKYGMWSGGIHDDIIDFWLRFNLPRNGSKWDKYKWRCNIIINVPALLKEGSAIVDGDQSGMMEAQNSSNAYKHAMRAHYQSVGLATALYYGFIIQNELVAFQYRNKAVALYDYSSSSKVSIVAKSYIESAVRTYGMAAHPVEDSTSPAHAGFQIWYDPSEVYIDGNPIQYSAYILNHMNRESWSVYRGMKNGPGNTVAGAMHLGLQLLLE